jgi:hypothetical protein
MEAELASLLNSLSSAPINVCYKCNSSYFLDLSLNFMQLFLADKISSMPSADSRYT